MEKSVIAERREGKPEHGHSRSRRRPKEENGRPERKKDELAHVAPNLRKRVSLSNKSEHRASKTFELTKDTYLLHTEESGGLEPENELENTLHIKQTDISSQSDIATQSKASFELDLSTSNLSPYIKSTYSRSGRSLLVASKKGHLAVTNWRQTTLQCELYLNETIRDATFLHNDSFFATAQKNHVYIYDSSGAQLHVLRKHHRESGILLNLPHHLLLASISAYTMPHCNLSYTDTSTGELIASRDFSSRGLGLSSAHSADMNRSNGIIHIGHNTGVVSLWSPISPKPLARVFCHSGGVNNVCVMYDGNDMITAGCDGNVKVTDLRTFRTRHSWKLPTIPTAMSVSQKGIIGMSFGATVQAWALPGSSVAQNAKLKSQATGGNSPYMNETFSGKRISGLEFCPFEDILAVTHTHGMLSMLIPGSGEATFDSSAPNPYETRKQRRENEVRMLLDKLPASSIALDPSFVGSVDVNADERLNEIKSCERQANVNRLNRKDEKKRAKGRNKIGKRLKRRQNNVIDAKKLQLEEELENRKRTRELAEEMARKDKEDVVAGTKAGAVPSESLPSALNRFFPKNK